MGYWLGQDAKALRVRISRAAQRHGIAADEPADNFVVQEAGDQGQADLVHAEPEPRAGEGRGAAEAEGAEVLAGDGVRVFFSEVRSECASWMQGRSGSSCA